jgi:hypothetical protein
VDTTSGFNAYVVAMEYGLVLVMALDLFINRLITDSKRIKDFEIKERQYTKDKQNKADS